MPSESFAPKHHSSKNLSSIVFYDSSAAHTPGRADSNSNQRVCAARAARNRVSHSVSGNKDNITLAGFVGGFVDESGCNNNSNNDAASSSTTTTAARTPASASSSSYSRADLIKTYEVFEPRLRGAGGTAIERAPRPCSSGLEHTHRRVFGGGSSSSSAATSPPAAASASSAASTPCLKSPTSAGGGGGGGGLLALSSASSAAVVAAMITPSCGLSINVNHDAALGGGAERRMRKGVVAASEQRPATTHGVRPLVRYVVDNSPNETAAARLRGGHDNNNNNNNGANDERVPGTAHRALRRPGAHTAFSSRATAELLAPDTYNNNNNNSNSANSNSNNSSSSCGEGIAHRSRKGVGLMRPKDHPWVMG